MSEIILEKELEKLKKFNKDLNWFQDNYAKLKEKHKGNYLAIKDEKVIDHDNNVDRLLERLKEKYEDTTSIVVEHINEHRYIYAM
jgi:hypothetical protein